jgi:hypothetical protein
VDIITRSDWGARSPRSQATTTWAQRTEFVVHYSEGPTTDTPRQIQDFHMDTRGWSDIGYNFLVDVQGRIYQGRGWLTIGAHATGHNTSAVGVCMIGRDGDATAAAKQAIRWLYDEACRHAGRTLTRRGHRDVNPTDCPGDQLYAWVRAGMPAPGMEDEVSGKDVWGYDIAVPDYGREEYPGYDKLDAGAWLRSAAITTRDTRSRVSQLQAAMARLETQLAQLSGVDVDEAAIVRGVLAGLTPAAIAAAVTDALPQDLARQVVDELGARLGAPDQEKEDQQS